MFGAWSIYTILPGFLREYHVQGGQTCVRVCPGQDDWAKHRYSVRVTLTLTHWLISLWTFLQSATKYSDYNTHVTPSAHIVQLLSTKKWPKSWEPSRYRQSQIKCVGCFCHFSHPKWYCMELSFAPLFRNSLCLLNWKFRLIWSSVSDFRAKTWFWEGQNLARKWLKFSQFQHFPIH